MTHPHSDPRYLDLVAYLDGELSPVEVRAVEDLLAQDPQARETLEALRRSWDVLDLLDDDLPTPQHLLPSIQSQLRPARSPWIPRLLAAAAVLAAAGLALALSNPAPAPPSTALRPDAPAPTLTPETHSPRPLTPNPPDTPTFTPRTPDDTLPPVAPSDPTHTWPTPQDPTPPQPPVQRPEPTPVAQADTFQDLSAEERAVVEHLELLVLLEEAGVSNPDDLDVIELFDEIDEFDLLDLDEG